ncbi:MAG: glycosyltransferase family 2 protein [Deltaproteobacteria bacterium]
MSHTVVCSMKDEGPYIVEWVSWYRMLGFSNILVLTNDCTDHSVELLDALARVGWLTHVAVDVPAGEFPTPFKLAVAKQHRLVTGATWSFLCDVDEFLVLKGVSLAELLPADADFIGMSINWRVFGTGGVQAWSDGLTHRQFLRSGGAAHPTGRWVKSAFRHAQWWKRLGVHAPVKWSGPVPARWVSSSGRDLRGFELAGGTYRMTERDEIDQSVAQVNHYMMRSAESFALKQGSMSPVTGKDRYGSRFVTNFDRNEVEDLSAMVHADAFDAVHAEAMALPDVARLHHLCCADYLARLAAKAGGSTKDDPRWQDHIAKAR